MQEIVDFFYQYWIEVDRRNKSSLMNRKKKWFFGMTTRRTQFLKK